MKKYFGIIDINMQFDGRGLICPLAFVKAKQALLKNNTKVFLLDDEVSIYNFCSFLEKQNLAHKIQRLNNHSQITLQTLYKDRTNK
jgi:TusA-related sulfurtransferase